MDGTTSPSETFSIESEDVTLIDVESLSPAMKPVSIAPEYSTPTRKKYVYLGLYFALSLLLTLFNKAILGKSKFPWLLTALHTSCSFVGCLFLLARGYFTLTVLGFRDNLIVIAFSFLFTVNIAISNVSLSMVSVPFHQIMRSTCPVFTILIYRFLYYRSYSMPTYLSLVPIILGVGLATYGDYYFTALGFSLTLVGVILASTKTVASNRLMTGGLALSPLEILLRMSPLAAIQSFLYAVLTGEGHAFLAWIQDGNITLSYGLALTSNGFIAFLLNVSSFYTNKLAGALTITVCANLKQCLTILLGVVAFDVPVTALNGYGMLLALIGAGLYSKVELGSRGKGEASLSCGPVLHDEERGRKL